MFRRLLQLVVLGAFAGQVSCRHARQQEAAKPAEQVVIRDPEKRVRVIGSLDAAGMQGVWRFFDAAGNRVADLTWKDGVRTGPLELMHPSKAGAAAGVTRLKGNCSAGVFDGFQHSFWPTGRKKLEREFDAGMLQGARGWQENGKEMTDGEAMRAAVEESEADDALIEELESFARLQVRRRQAEKGEPETAPAPAALEPDKDEAP